MKKIIFLILVSTISISWAQKISDKHHNRFSKKFEELEKIKLLETLNLDEETTLKFFARRNSVKIKIKSLLKESKENYNNIETILAEGGNISNSNDLLVKKYDLEKQVIDEKANFINSLNDILSKEQVLKYVLFERKFKSDVRDLLIEKGRRKFKKERFEKK